jgi:tetratricopeptide (TPR) repeat protein
VTESLHRAALAHIRADDPAGAEPRLRAILAATPDGDGAWNNLAASLAKRDRLTAAEVCARKAVALGPLFEGHWCTLASILHREQHYDAALEAFGRALDINPHFVDALWNRGLTLYELGRLDESIADFDAAMMIAGENVNPVMLADAAYPVVASGDYLRGFTLAEHRWPQLRRTAVWDLGIPQWLGEDLAGKTLLVHQDQGYGDTIHWMRYLEDIPADRVIAAVPWPLLRLFRINGYEVVDIDGPLPEADYHLAFSSLPQRLRIEPPTVASPAYLSARGPVEMLPVGSDTRFKIGIAWSANQVQEYGRRKSMPLQRLLPLAMIPGIQLYSIQCGPAADDIVRAGAEMLVTNMAPMIRDWADTASIVNQLDMVVTIDSAPLHLAGAMGKTTIGLLPFVPCWRWPRGCATTAWYPRLHLLFQDRPGDWRPQVDAAAALIREEADRRLRLTK